MIGKPQTKPSQHALLLVHALYFAAHWSARVGSTMPPNSACCCAACRAANSSSGLSAAAAAAVVVVLPLLGKVMLACVLLMSAGELCAEQAGRQEACYAKILIRRNQAA
jgi:hypothetical protein